MTVPEFAQPLVCRGDWLLKSACGKCAKCKRTKGKALERCLGDLLKTTGTKSEKLRRKDVARWVLMKIKLERSKSQGV